MPLAPGGAGSPPTTFAESLRSLRAAQKPARGVSYYSSRINRPWGRVLAAGLHPLGVSPNVVSLVSGLVSLIGVVLVVALPRTWWSGVVIAALLALGFALDSADGQIARLRGTSSRAGEWLDHMIDCAVKLSLHAAVLIAWYRAGVDDRLLLLPVAFGIVSVLLFFGGTLRVLLDKDEAASRARKPISPWRALLLLPVDYGVLAVAFVLWGFPGAFQVAYAALFVAYAVSTVGFSAMWFRQLR